MSDAPAPDDDLMPQIEQGFEDWYASPEVSSWLQVLEVTAREQLLRDLLLVCYRAGVAKAAALIQPRIERIQHGLKGS